MAAVTALIALDALVVLFALLALTVLIVSDVLIALGAEAAAEIVAEAVAEAVAAINRFFSNECRGCLSRSAALAKVAAGAFSKKSLDIRDKLRYIG